MLPSPASLPELGSFMVSRDHCPFGSAAAFFKESMRRDAMTEIIIVFALWNQSFYLGHSKVASTTRRENLHSRQEPNFLLNICTR